MSEFGNHTHPVARKEYRCEWCGEKILRGEKHFKYAGMWEGDFQNYRMHLECENACSFENSYGEGFNPFENERPAKKVVDPPSENIPADRTCTSCTP